MCQIYVRRKDCLELPYDIVLNETYFNKDGAGLSFVDDSGILQVMHSFDYDIVEKMIREFEKENREFVVHFRYSTAGNNSKDNLHPFYITDDLVMFHNGTIMEFAGDKKKSDTRLFSEFLAEIGIHTMDDVKLFENEIIELIGTSYDKLVFMDSLGEIYIINDWIGEYSYDGLLWSSSIDPFREVKQAKKKSKVFANAWDYDYYEHTRTFDNNYSEIIDSFGNFSPDEMDILQYLMDYEPDKIKQAIRNSKLYQGVKV